MADETWRQLLIGALAFNAAAGFGYRVYRLTKGGPMADVIGQAVLGVILAGLAIALATGVGWPRWPALVYGLVFAVVVMPIWVLAVLIPIRPGTIDYVFTLLYWFSLAAIVIAALFL